MTTETRASGSVRRKDKPFIINSAGGSSTAIGEDISGYNGSWGATVDNPDTGPDGTAGHYVSTDGNLTASGGYQIVAASESNPDSFVQNTSPRSDR